MGAIEEGFMVGPSLSPQRDSSFVHHRALHLFSFPSTGCSKPAHAAVHAPIQLVAPLLTQFWQQSLQLVPTPVSIRAPLNMSFCCIFLGGCWLADGDSSLS